MSDFMNTLTGFLGPAGTGAVAHALIGLLILIAGLIVVKFLGGIAARILKRATFLYRSNADGSITDFVSPVRSFQ